jgi:two-component system OmpR family sensor kinase
MSEERRPPVAGSAPRPWSAAARLLARTPLRVELIVAMLVLVTVALTLISVASVAVLRGYLVGRLDQQLATVSGRLASDRLLGAPPVGGPGQGGIRVGAPSPFLVQRRDAAGQLEREFNEPIEEGGQPPNLPSDAAWLAARGSGPFTVPAAGGAGRWRVAVAPRQDGSGGFVVAAVRLDEIDRTIGRLRGVDLVVSAAVLLVLAAVGVALVRASLRPLVEIERTAGAIAAGDLARRVPDLDPRTEVGRLARAFNSMLAQIEAAFRARAGSEAAARRSEERMRRFVADASHELRTPLTAIRGFAELYRQGAAAEPAEVDRLLRRIEDQAARMGLLVEDLLLLAHLDQQRPLERQPVDLLALAADAVNDARAMQPGRPVELRTGEGPAAAPLVVLGDEQRLRQVVANLMGNALAHTPADSPVEVVASTERREEACALLEVVDHGPGLNAEQAERVFERFYRADPARSHGDGGTGLGLAIVAALVAAHGGAVEVDTAPGRGARFRVLLPLAPGAAGPVAG